MFRRAYIKNVRENLYFLVAQMKIDQQDSQPRDENNPQDEDDDSDDEGAHTPRR